MQKDSGRIKKHFGDLKGKGIEIVRRFNPYVMISIPCLLAEMIQIATGFAGRTMVSDFLLRVPSQWLDLPVWMWIGLGLIECAYWALSVVFLRPVFQAHRRGDAATSVELIQARLRVYNFPSFLIRMTWMAGAIQFTLLGFAIHERIPVLSIVSTGIVSTSVTAIVVFYSADLLNRFVLIPHWFANGRIEVSRKLMVPTIFLRFGDVFFVNAFLPVISICGIIFVTYQHGIHDSDELRRLLIVIAGTGGLFWIFGGLVTFALAATFMWPMRAMRGAIAEFKKGNFLARIAVHSDDHIGKLEQAMNEMGSALEEKELIKTVFGHYVSPSVRDLILNGKVRTEGDRIEAVVLFSDIRSFTALSENHPPERIVKLLNIHFTRIVDIVSRHDGFVDKFIGDAVMAVFDEELTRGKHRISALRAAAQILNELEQTNNEIAALGFQPIKIGIGIAAGPVIRGNIGSDSRRELTVIGDTVNLASRLESATKEQGKPMLATKESFDESCREIQGLKMSDEISINIRGRTDLVNVFAFELI